MRSTLLCLAIGFSLAACAKDPPPSQYPQQQQGYPPPQQQGYPQQQPPMQQQPQQGYTPPAQQQTAPATASSAGTPTAIPGVTKLANGQCSVTPPSLTGQPVAPLVGPCPPGL